MSRIVTYIGVLALFLVFGLMAAPSSRAEDPQNILFYGNSFTLGSGSTMNVPEMMQGIILAAGRTSPSLINAAVSGKDFTFHLTRNLRVIDRRISESENWDFVVMQNFSTAPTRLGDVDQHRTDSVSLYQKVAERSPEVTPVLFETWARAPDHDFYHPATLKFPGGPAQMQQEVRNGYRLAAEDIDAASNPGTARIAPVGDAWENRNWVIENQNLHGNDLYHAANPGTLLAALTIYATIYQDDTADIDLSDLLSELNLPASYGPTLAAAADHAVFGVPEPSTFVMLMLACGGLLLSTQRTTACHRIETGN